MDALLGALEKGNMSTLHFVGGEKGGVGKSVVARLLAQIFLDSGITFVGVDADTSHGTLIRFYRDFSSAVDLSSFESADQIMDRALGAERRVIVDLPAQSARHLRKWLDTGDVVAFSREMGVRLVFWHVSDGGYDSVSQLSGVKDVLGEDVQIVIVKNHGRSPNFSQLEESSLYAALVGAGTKVVDLPELEPATMYHIDRHGLSFWAAIHNTSGDWVLPPMARRRVDRWLSEARSAIETAGDLL